MALVKKNPNVVNAAGVWTEESRKLWAAQRSREWNEDTAQEAARAVKEVSYETARKYVYGNDLLRHAGDPEVYRIELIQWWRERAQVAAEWRIVDLVVQWAQVQGLGVREALQINYVEQRRGLEAIAADVGTTRWVMRKVVERHGFRVHDKTEVAGRVRPPGASPR